MTTAEAAELIGCTTQHVRTLIQTKRLRAKRINKTIKVGPKKGYKWFEWDVSHKEATRYRDSCNGIGRPRISTRTQ